MRSFLIAAILSAATSLGAAGPDVANFGRLAFRNFTDRDGLPQNTILTLVTDHRGYLWVGTQDGAAYYNGRKWTVVNMPNRTVSNSVRVLLAASDSSLWFGTEGGGLHRLKDGRWTSYSQSSGLPMNVVWSLLETHSANGTPVLWAGTPGNGLGRLENGVWSTVRKASGLPDEVIRCLLETTAANGKKTLWAGTYQGLAALRDGKWTTVDRHSGLPDNRVLSLLETPGAEGGRTLWVGTAGGLARFEANKWTLFDTRSGLPNDWVDGLAATSSRDGSLTLWAATFGGGLGRFHQGAWTTIDSGAGLPSNMLISLLPTQTKAGNRTLWVGTDGGGLARYQSGSWITYDTHSGLPNNVVHNLLETRGTANGSRSFWFGTFGGGLARLEEGRWSIINDRSGLPMDSVYSLAETTAPDGTRTLWVGTDGGGLARLEGGRWTMMDTQATIGSNRIWTLRESKTGADGSTKLWVGTNGGGLWSYDGGAWTSVLSRQNGLPNNVITCVLETIGRDGSRTLWVGTYGGGLARLSEGRLTLYGLGTGFPNDIVTCLSEITSSRGERRLWAGTQGAGVAILDLDRPGNPPWDVLSDATDPALPNNVVSQISEDSRGRIYVYTNKGIARLTPSLQKIGEISATPRYALRVFTTDDGLPSNECYAAMQDSTGRVWAGTAGGAALFDPLEEVEDRDPDPVYIERAVAAKSGQAIATFAADEGLAHDQNDVVFEFAMLSYEHETETSYRTHLAGLDERPSAWSTDFKKEYTNLPAGAYIFNVWGRDYAGNVSGPSRIAFSVRPAPWQTWWAYVLYAIGITTFAYGAVRLRMRTLRKDNEILETRIAERTAEIADQAKNLRASRQAAIESEERAIEANRAKSRFLSNMSHELRTPLNAIIGYSELLTEDALESDHPHIVPDLQRIRAAGKHELELINNILDLSKIEAGKMELHLETFAVCPVVDDAVEIVRHLIEKRSNTLSVDCPPEIGSMRADITKLLQSLFNLLSNAAKFTENGRIAVVVSRRAEHDDEWIRFTVRDTGIGMSEAHIGKLFKPFSQADVTTTRDFGGTGLGLTITQRYAQMMGGDVTVESAPGKGSTFTLSLPARVRLPSSELAAAAAER